MTPFIPDLATVRRAEAIIAAYAASRVQLIADRPGNPLDAQIRRHGEAVALRVPVFGDHFFNRACGFDDEQLDAARDVIAWYAENNVPGMFEVLPGVPSERLMALLAEHGYRHVRFHATFAGPAQLPTAPSPGVEVRLVETDDDLAAFAEAYHLGWANTGPRVPARPWLTAPGWRLYLGLCDGEPAGAAILYVRDGVGYLADSAVDPRWRRRGVHRALLDARCADAASAGCAEIFSGAEYLSASCRNMLRKGLSLLLTKALWRAPTATA
jgi:ribosomal protein S18 acetylase RimI-like enzyme